MSINLLLNGYCDLLMRTVDGFIPVQAVLIKVINTAMKLSFLNNF